MPQAVLSSSRSAGSSVADVVKVGGTLRPAASTPRAGYARLFETTFHVILCEENQGIMGKQEVL